MSTLRKEGRIKVLGMESRKKKKLSNNRHKDRLLTEGKNMKIRDLQTDE